MSTYLFDVQGTLVGNPSVTDEDIRKMLLVLGAAGHRLVLMTGLPSAVPHDIMKLVDACYGKPVMFADFDEGTVVFDDDTELLQYAAHYGMKVVHASQMGAWIASERWQNGSGQQDLQGGYQMKLIDTLGRLSAIFGLKMLYQMML